MLAWLFKGFVIRSLIMAEHLRITKAKYQCHSFGLTIQRQKDILLSLSRACDVSTMAMNSVAWTPSRCVFPNSFVKQIAQIACWVFYFLIFLRILLFYAAVNSLLVGLCLSGLVTTVPSMVLGTCQATDKYCNKLSNYSGMLLFPHLHLLTTHYF